MILSTNGVNFKSNLNPYSPVDTNSQQKYQRTEPYNTDTFEKQNKDSNKNKKIAAGIMGAAAVIGLGIFALGKGRKPNEAVTDGIKKEVENLSKGAENVVPKAENTALGAGNAASGAQRTNNPLIIKRTESEINKLFDEKPENFYKELEESYNSGDLVNFNSLCWTQESKLLKKYGEMSVEELEKCVQNADKSKPAEYFYSLKTLFNKKGSKAEAEELVKFLDECSAGKHNLILANKNSNRVMIESYKDETLLKLSKIYKNERNFEKELEMLEKIKTPMAELQGAIAENYVQRGDPKKGLKIAYESCQNKLKSRCGSAELSAMAKACDALGEKELGKIISLVKKGKSWCTADEIKFLADNGISWEEKITNNGLTSTFSSEYVHGNPEKKVLELVNSKFKLGIG